ncbi:MAG: PAS domain S-box protein [Chloroflexaceae bacterium]|nr:PAS domain S-box protein [Chloroflexaceae bacterium]NJO06980.1 PAS domain S-box protein [Chloroflexaceae bacterium]
MPSQPIEASAALTYYDYIDDILAQQHTAFWMCRSDTTVTISRSWYLLCGLADTTTTLTTNAWLAMIHPDDRPALQMALQQCCASESTGVGLYVRAGTDDDNSRWLDLRGNVLEYSAEGYPEAIGGTVRLVDGPPTEALLLAAIVDQAPVAIFAKDDEGHNLFINHYMHSDEWRNPKRIHEEIRFPIVDERGETILYGGVGVDVTDRKAIERQLRRQANYTYAMLDVAPVALISTDPLLRVVSWNPAAEALFGYSFDEASGRLITDLIAPNEPDCSQVVSNAMQALQGTPCYGEVMRYHKDGTMLEVHGSAVAIQFDGETAGVMIAHTDIRPLRTTELRLERAERERLRLQQQIIEAQEAALRELSTPLIPISDGVMVLPMIGAFDMNRAQHMTSTLLEGVERSQARVVILDVTGVRMADAQAADHLVQAARAVRLLGARLVMTGIQPQMAHQLIGLGIDLASIETYSTLQTGISAALSGQRNVLNGHRRI